MLVKLALALALGLLAVGTIQYLLGTLERSNTDGAGPLPPRGTVLVVALVVAAVLGLVMPQSMGPLPVIRSCWVAAMGVIAVVDLRARYILDACTVPFAVLALLSAAILEHPTVGEALSGGLVGLVAFALVYGASWLLARREALGLGDVKLAALLGLWLGVAYVPTALAAGIVLAGAAALALLATRRGRLRGHSLAYGPWLCLGGYLALLQLSGRP